MIFIFILFAMVVSILLTLLFMEKSMRYPREVIAKPVSNQLVPHHLSRLMMHIERDTLHGTTMQTGADGQVFESRSIVRPIDFDYKASHVAFSKEDMVSFESPCVFQQEESFGKQVLVSNMLVFVTAHTHNVGQLKNVGVVYIFRRDTRQLYQTVYPPVMSEDLMFGTGIEISEHMLITQDGHGTMYHTVILDVEASHHM